MNAHAERRLSICDMRILAVVQASLVGGMGIQSVCWPAVMMLYVRRTDPYSCPLSKAPRQDRARDLPTCSVDTDAWLKSYDSSATICCTADVSGGPGTMASRTRTSPVSSPTTCTHRSCVRRARNDSKSRVSEMGAQHMLAHVRC